MTHYRADDVLNGSMNWGGGGHHKHLKVHINIFSVGDSDLDGFWMFVFLHKAELVMNENTVNGSPVMVQPVVPECLFRLLTHTLGQ